MIQYDQFYKRFGVRQAHQLMSPPLPVIDKLQLPKHSIVHYFGDGPLDDGPVEDNTLFNHNTHPIRIQHVVALTSVTGGPRRIAMETNDLIRRYRATHQRFRPLTDLSATQREPNSLVVFNYSYLHRLYKYMRNRFTAYNRRSNILSTLVSTLNQNQNPMYEHYLELIVPSKLPSVTMLKRAERGMTLQLIDSFSDQSNMLIMEIWNWLGEDRQDTMFSQQAENSIKKLNLIIRENDRWTVVSLGQLDQWRRGGKRELSGNTQANRKGLNTEVVQKRFLRLLMSVMETRSSVVEENLGSEDESVPFGPTHSDSFDESTTDASNTSMVSASDQASEREAYGTYSSEDEIADAQKLKEDIDLDLDLLEELNKEGIVVPKDDTLLDEDSTLPGNEPASSLVQEELEEALLAPYPDNPTDAFKLQCNRLADGGDITAAEYRAALENADAWKSIDVGGVPLGEYVKIAPEAVSVQSVQVMADRASIVDKSMLMSSLEVMDKQYVEQVMLKDIASMVVNIQGAGVRVIDYKVNEVEDITGASYEFSVRVKPLRGAATTLSFKIPKVKPDGTFVTNGVGYRTRKQWGSLPLCKLRPDTVALSNVSSKLFVMRSERKADNYPKWLSRSVMAIGLNDENPTVQHLVTGNAFDKSFEAPRLFTTLSQSFRSFTLSANGVSYNCHFGNNKRDSVYPPAKLTELEVNGSRIIGLSNDEQYLVVDSAGTLFSEHFGTITQMPSIESILSLDEGKAPVEFSVLKVFRAMIPVGLALGYLMGLSNLVKRLGVKPRIVPAGKRVSLLESEWPIVFEDETWVFSRQDRLASMVLAGFREYVKSTSKFIAAEFETKDVYLNVFEEKKITVRNMKELDILEQLFVDPITKGLLEEMKEPTVFRELLIRSSEMLLADQHPDEADARHMRLKGYERFAGFVYTELVRCARIQSARPGRERFGLELNPYAVWIAVQQDPAKDQISEINPIQNLKESEAATFSGTGGRNSRSMVTHTRVYHPSAMGTISESTVDSSDVGVNTFTSANPQFNSIRGTTDAYDTSSGNIASLLSTSAMVSPGSTRDD